MVVGREVPIEEAFAPAKLVLRKVVGSSTRDSVASRRDRLAAVAELTNLTGI